MSTLKFFVPGLVLLFFFSADAFSTGPVATPSSGTWRFDDKNMNPAIDPGEDFFEFANGGWRERNPIPDEHARWGTFSILRERNLKLLHEIMEEVSAANAHSGSIEQKIGDFYRSGMDIEQINRSGIGPLRPELEKIDSIDDRERLLNIFVGLQRMGVPAPFYFGQMQDFEDSTQVIAVAYQAGLGLPDRDYYLKEDDAFATIRQEYVEHVSRMLQLAGLSGEEADKSGRSVMKMETDLAEASMSRIERRDPHAIYNPMSLEEADALTPSLAWPRYLELVDAPPVERLNVAMPDFFEEIDRKLREASLEDWKAYLKWHTVSAFAPYLSEPFVDENFKMQSVLSGVTRNRERWKRVIDAADEALGFAVGQLFVERHFSADARDQVLAMLENIKAVLRDDLAHLPWMSAETRRRALEKLSRIVEKIGYPDEWRDYSTLEIDRGPYVVNMIRANQFEFDRQIAKIGKPVDRHEWAMTPQTVNAYYHPSKNEIVFPAGILQPPFFDPDAPPAANYGAIGMVIGHEITHGFDDKGSQYNGEGNLENWWTEKDLKRFKEAAACISDQFSGYEVEEGLHLQGPLVTGEAIADLGGLKIAYRALERGEKSSMLRDRQGDPSFSADQIFFLSFAHVWASNIRPEEARRRVTVDTHPPARYRVNGTLANFPEFFEAFEMDSDSAMRNRAPCEIW